MKAALRIGTAVFVTAVFVHFLWEMLQSFAYDMAGMPLERVVRYHLLATVGDALLMLLPYALLALWRRDPVWIARMRPADAGAVLALGVLLSVPIEWHALAAGRWHYTAAMPLIPGLGVGALPVLQLMLLPFPVYWAAWRLAGRPALPRKDGMP